MVAVSTSPPHGTVIIIGTTDDSMMVGEAVLKAVQNTGCCVVISPYPEPERYLAAPVDELRCVDVAKLCAAEPESDVYAKTCPRCGGSRRSAFNPRKPCGRCGGSGSL